MLGVVADRTQESVVREFFELFKTPWEFYRPNHDYDVVLCAGEADVSRMSCRLVVIYTSRQLALDTGRVVGESLRNSGRLTFAGTQIPLYSEVLAADSSGQAVTWWDAVATVENPSTPERPRCVRLGYDLFREIGILLVAGQPSSNAAVPALELHIALLRRLITGSGIPLVEIPPVPAGHPFLVCLTHDCDHPSIRSHKFDATAFGFLYRATIGSANNWIRGRIPLSRVLTNWWAAAKLPLVYTGFAADFWYDFDRYVDIEGGRPSTFFVIPFSNRPGRGPDGSSGPAPAKRAARYDLADIRPKLERLNANGREIGLHGIDAWADSAKGREEAGRITEICPTPEVGVRMHWLYRSDRSAAVLEEAGFSYDSTVGYNETVGYRAGTTQAFKPFDAQRLLELPLHVMDTALFYPDYLDLTEREAASRLSAVFDDFTQLGGVLTFNWHDRSIAPERLWGEFYLRVLKDLTARGVWFCTASQAVAWFRMRRSAAFDIHQDGERTSIRVMAEESSQLPGLRLRYHKPQVLESGLFSTALQDAWEDIGFDGSVETNYQWTDSKIVRSR